MRKLVDIWGAVRWRGRWSSWLRIRRRWIRSSTKADSCAGRPESESSEIPYHSAMLTRARRREALPGPTLAPHRGSPLRCARRSTIRYRVFAEAAAPAADPRGRSDCRQCRHAGCRAGRHAAGAATAGAPSPADGFAQRWCGSGLLGASSPRRLVDARRRRGHRFLVLSDREGVGSVAGVLHVAVRLLLGAIMRLPEEPERHAWQADAGTAPCPGDHRIHNVATPGAALRDACCSRPCRLGEQSEVRVTCALRRC